MRTTQILSVLFALALVAGCGKKDGDKGKKDDKADKADKADKDKGADKAKDDKAADKAKDDGDMPGLANKMKYCPSAVPNAKTTVEEADGKVAVTVTVEGDAVGDVRRRAAHLEAVDKADSSTVNHSGEGTGGGGFGQCPVVMEKTSLTIEHVDNGVKIALTPDEGMTSAELKANAETRLKNLPGGGGKGGHKGGGGDKTGKGEGKGEGSGTGTDGKK